ncbi:MAG: tail fiber domain-containing protein [Cyclobacteriaceae bacterium]|nr:tail fiber domain-containing protein [Cyclobacteriaceae bacterium SS2]
MIKLFTALAMLMVSISVYSQNNSKIPFQGNITQEGVPIDGSRKFVFSIPDVSWTETHDAVSITNGFYSVVLGSINPLPGDLFDDVESRSLAITIESTSLGSLDIYAPFTTTALQADSLSETFESGAGIGIGYAFSIDGEGKEVNRAIFGQALTEGYNVGVQGNSRSSATSTARNTGVYGDAQGDGSGDHRGVLGYANSAGKYNKGLYGIAEGEGNGDSGKGYGVGSINFGVEGNAGGNAWNNTGVEGSNFGEQGQWNFGVHGISNAGTGDAVENHGVAGRAYGSGINYGVWAEAGGGTENWAGFFSGDLKVTGNLVVDGDMNLPDSIGATATPGDLSYTLMTTISGDTPANINHAFRADATTEGLNIASAGYAVSKPTNTSNQYGLYGQASGAGNGSHNGVYGYASSVGKYNRGLRGIAEGAGNGDTGTGYGEGSVNFGLEGNAAGNAWNNTGVEGSNYGTEGQWNFGIHGISNAGTGTTVENHGVAGRAYGSGKNYGVYGEAANGAENWAGYFNGDVQVNGNISATGDIAGATITPSDRNLKENIEPIANPLSIVHQLNGVRYTWNDKAQGSRPGTHDIGVIAQEVEAVLPELVKETPDGYKAVNYAQLVAVLIEAIKDLESQVETLRVENEALEAKLSDYSELQQLKQQVESIQKVLNLKADAEVSVTSVQSSKQ